MAKLMPPAIKSILPVNCCSSWVQPTDPRSRLTPTSTSTALRLVSRASRSSGTTSAARMARRSLSGRGERTATKSCGCSVVPAPSLVLWRLHRRVTFLHAPRELGLPECEVERVLPLPPSSTSSSTVERGYCSLLGGFEMRRAHLAPLGTSTLMLRTATSSGTVLIRMLLGPTEHW